jgi:hypothetical protein
MGKDLTPQEKRIVQYHRDNIRFNNVGRDEEGRPVTVYSTGVEMDSGPYKGKFVSVPGYIGGKIQDEDIAREYWRSEINKGNWPVYDSSKELNKRSKEIHQTMDDEVPEALAAGKAKGYKKGGKVRSASKRADGIAQRGKTRGTMIMCGGGMAKRK